MATAYAGEDDVLASVRPAIEKLTSEFEQIPADRQKELKKAALFIRTKIQAGEPAQLTFICTHNSRRSHLAQIWTQTAAAYYDVEGIKAYSGGTESTAMNIRTVDALRRVGFSLTDSTGGNNPVYLVKFSDTKSEIRGYSKVYSADGNPKDNYAAFMTCSQADKNCPVVQGSTFRIAIPYDDPKAADGMPEEVARYDERTQQIGREMLYMISLVKG
ncbi:MAG: protein-tyrosine-phosphatase [Methylobacter sp.]|nr:MAG: protein-tyrosine-phosphatase [Methylobacter sp.]PPD24193.1 MAG: protein-tyrosine-phosphatase [Methylobacter sp.]PPD37621.1 MAG: protein-tyrosine-phosphatase [Methylomonas sp.]